MEKIPINHRLRVVRKNTRKIPRIKQRSKTKLGSSAYGKDIIDLRRGR